MTLYILRADNAFVFTNPLPNPIPNAHMQYPVEEINVKQISCRTARLLFDDIVKAFYNHNVMIQRAISTDEALTDIVILTHSCANLANILEEKEALICAIKIILCMALIFAQISSGHSIDRTAAQNKSEELMKDTTANKVEIEKLLDDASRECTKHSECASQLSTKFTNAKSVLENIL